MSDSGNEGIIMHGNARIDARGPVAVGRGAVASVANAHAAESPETAERWKAVQAHLETLMEQIAASEVPERNGLLKTTADVANELAKPEPNRISVSALLSGIAESVQSFSAIAAAVEAAKVAIMALI